MKKILVPVDLSEVSEHATRFAVELAEKNDAEIMLLNSVHFDYYTDYEFNFFATAAALMKEVKETMEEKLAAFAKKFDTRLKIKTMVHEASLVPAIKELVKEEGYDLVVMGTHGASGLEEIFIGSNAEKVVRNVPCPVISVPRRCSVNAIKRILVPIDVREIKASFLIEIAALQKQFDAKLEFLWVKTPHNVENEEKVSQELYGVLRHYGISDFDFTIVRNIFPSDGILMHADETNADMIAMATHARKGIAHWLSGSLAEETINHIKIPVWTFKLNKEEESVTLESVKVAHGKPEYKKIKPLTVD